MKKHFYLLKTCLCALAVGGCALALYRMQVGSLRALQQMVCRICEAGGGGGDALSSVRGGGVMREIGRELEYFFALERKRQWEEAERLARESAAARGPS